MSEHDVTASIDIDNLTRNETTAAFNALPVGASLWIQRKPVILGGTRYHVRATDLTVQGARDFTADVLEHMEAVMRDDGQVTP